MIEGELVEFLLDSMSRVGDGVILEGYGLNELVDQLGKSSQLEVDFDQDD